MKYTFCPQSEEVEVFFKAELKEKGLSVDELLNFILRERYKVSQEGLSREDTIKQIDAEIKSFVFNSAHAGKYVTLNEMSKTMANVATYYGGKPTGIKAFLGKHYAKLFGNPPFEHVKVSRTEDGKIRRDSYTRAAIYHITERENKK